MSLVDLFEKIPQILAPSEFRYDYFKIELIAKFNYRNFKINNLKNILWKEWYTKKYGSAAMLVLLNFIHKFLFVYNKSVNPVDALAQKPLSLFSDKFFINF